MVIEKKGNILNTHCKVIAHGVNCQGKMGSGVAKVLFDKWPLVREDYLDYYKESKRSIEKIGTEVLLGMVVPVVVGEDEKVILNCFTQNKYGYDGKKYVDYEAIYRCFRRIKHFADEIAIPRIGCGLAGGDWEAVKAIINHAVGDDCKIYAYYL